MAYISVARAGGIEMRYAKFGSGKENFVILPGISTQYVTPSAGRVERLYSGFTEKYTVYLFDRREDFPEKYTLRQMAEDTVNILKSLGVERADFFGTSQGSMIAQYIAVFHPETVSKLVLASSSCGFSENAGKFFDALSGNIEKGNRRGLSDAFARYVYSEKTLEKYGEYLSAANDGLTDEELSRFKSIMNATGSLDIVDKLGQIKCPTFVIGSRDDKIFGEAEQRELSERIGCKIYLYSGYGHAVFDEAPDFTDKVFEFLTNG